MSEEQLFNVEDDTPDPVVPEAPPVAEVPPVEAAAPPEEATDPGVVEVAGQKLVPLSAMISERKQRQALAEKAARTDQLEAYVNESRPYVEFLKANPDLLKPRQAAPPPPTSFGAPPPDPQVESLARTLDLYTPEGQPDLVRATTIRTMMTQTAEQIARQTIAPIHEQTHQDQSARNFQIALTYKDPQGRSPSKESLTAIWRTMEARQTADPNVASIMTLTALGLDYANHKPGIAPPAQPPIVTEGAGGGARRPALSQLEASIARDRGVSEAKWQEHTKGFVPGRSQQLED